MTASDRRMAVRLEWATIVWNLGEFFVTVALGVMAGSIALIAFGIDSLIEVFASGVVVWHEAVPDRAVARTRLAHRLIALAFFALAVALTIAAVRRLLSGISAEPSPFGMAYLSLVVLVMGWLGVWKGRLAQRLGSTPLAAEARVTLLDAALASSVLAALAINAVWKLGWVDPAAAILVAIVAVREGFENLGPVSSFDSERPIEHDDVR